MLSPGAAGPLKTSRPGHRARQRPRPRSVPDLCVRAPGSSVHGGDVCLAMALAWNLVPEALLTVPIEEIPEARLKVPVPEEAMCAVGSFRGHRDIRSKRYFARKGSSSEAGGHGMSDRRSQTRGLGETSQKYPRGQTWGGATACHLPAGCSELGGTALGTPRAGPGFLLSCTGLCQLLLRKRPNSSVEV